MKDERLKLYVEKVNESYIFLSIVLDQDIDFSWIVFKDYGQK
jgi:hypothetical protein